jgi:hypothetical protein
MYIDSKRPRAFGLVQARRDGTYFVYIEKPGRLAKD